MRNISFANGDHGFDNRESDGTRLISNTAYGNQNDGFSIEGNVAGITLANNIGADNGVLTGGNDLFVDDRIDDRLRRRTTTSGGTRRQRHRARIEFAGVAYDTVAAFQDGHRTGGAGLRPRPAARRSGGRRLPSRRRTARRSTASNAAVAGFQALDFDGLPPVDLPAVPNTGAGVPNFADRGALEAVDEDPTAKLRREPRRVVPGEVFTADASQSTRRHRHRELPLRLGRRDGDQATGPIASHAYTSTGVKHVRLTVTDGAGQTADAQQPVQVRSGKPSKADTTVKAPKAPKAPKGGR